MIWDKGIWSFYFVPLRMCLVEWILGKMEKKNKERNFFGGCLVGRERGKRRVKPEYFLLIPTGKFSPQN